MCREAAGWNCIQVLECAVFGSFLHMTLFSHHSAYEAARQQTASAAETELRSKFCQ